ncbi:MAG: hypothetical protein ACLQBX_17705 [Candidatus Limnocylindrales bacterium]
MLPPPPHYEPCHPYLLQGDIGYFPFTQVLRPSESTVLPSGSMPPTEKGVPVFEGMRQTAVNLGGADHLLRHWYGLGVVVDQTSELRNSPKDSRVTVAALVSENACGLTWDAAVAGRYAGVLVLPEASLGSIGDDFPPIDWPGVAVLGRSLTTVSRGIVESGRMMTLTPPMAALLAAKLAEMFGDRQWARMKHLANVEGQQLVRIDDLGKEAGPPPSGRWALLHFGNHERLQVFVSPKD